MPATLRIPVTLASLAAEQDEGRCGLLATFAPQLLRHSGEPLRDYFDLSAPLSLDSARGLAQVVRLLRAARLAARGPTQRWLGDPNAARAALSAAVGRRIVITATPRSCVRFTAWTEQGVHALDFVADVRSDSAGFAIRRVGSRPGAFLPRHSVLRHETARQTWLEVVNVEPR